MLGWALTFLVIAVVAGFLGFGGLAGTAMGAAKIVFLVAMGLFILTTIVGAIRGRRA